MGLLGDLVQCKHSTICCREIRLDSGETSAKGGLDRGKRKEGRTGRLIMTDGKRLDKEDMRV